MIKNFQAQAETAERLARSINDRQTCDALLNYARECREKAKVQVQTVPHAWSDLSKQHVQQKEQTATDKPAH